MRWQQLYNPFVTAILRSPLHALMSDSTMLITYTGRRSGKTRTTPVNFVVDGETLLSVSPRGRSWWKNLRGKDGAPVAVRLRGMDFKGVGRAFEGEAAVEEGGLLTVLQRVPAHRRYWKVELTPEGEPKDPGDLSRVARDNVLVRIRDLVPREWFEEASMAPHTKQGDAVMREVCKVDMSTGDLLVAFGPLQIPAR